jgi:uncharacterized cupin superfamily protein
MKKIDIEKLPVRRGSGYPAPYDEPVAARERRPLVSAAGLTEFGVNMLTLRPGVWSSQRHWHSHEDEFVFVVSGEIVLVTDGGEEILRAGECAAFRAGDPDGHHLINRSEADAVVLEIGNNDPARDRTVYSDIDMILAPGHDGALHKDGTPYPSRG